MRLIPVCYKQRQFKSRDGEYRQLHEWGLDFPWSSSSIQLWLLFHFFQMQFILQSGKRWSFAACLLHTFAFHIIDGALPDTADSNREVAGRFFWKEATPFIPHLLQSNWCHWGTACTVMFSSDLVQTHVPWLLLCVLLSVPATTRLSIREAGWMREPGPSPSSICCTPG